jgi:nitrilase
MIFGPDGRPLCEPVGDGVEAIVTADIDLGDIDYAKTFIDTVGHSSRPDLLSLLVNAEAAKHVTVMK